MEAHAHQSVANQMLRFVPRNVCRSVSVMTASFSTPLDTVSHAKIVNNVVIMKSGRSVAARVSSNTVHVWHRLVQFVMSHRVRQSVSPCVNVRRARIVTPVASVSHATFVDRMNTGTIVAVRVAMTSVAHRRLPSAPSNVWRGASVMLGINAMRLVYV